MNIKLMTEEKYGNMEICISGGNNLEIHDFLQAQHEKSNQRE